MTAISPRSGVVPLLRLFRGEIVSKARVILFVVLGLVGWLLALAVRSSDTTDYESGIQLVNGYSLAFVAPVAALVFASAALGDPDDDRTLVYLWLTPVPRRVLAITAWAAAAAVTAAVVVLPAAGTGLIASESWRAAGAAAAATFMASIAYSAVFCAIGLRFTRSLLWGLVYILVWEGAVASVPAADRFTVRAYTRSVLGELAEVELRQGGAGLVWALVVLVAITVGGIAYTSWRLGRHDVD